MPAFCRQNTLFVNDETVVVYIISTVLRSVNHCDLCFNMYKIIMIMQQLVIQTVAIFKNPNIILSRD